MVLLSSPPTPCSTTPSTTSPFFVSSVSCFTSLLTDNITSCTSILMKLPVTFCQHKMIGRPRTVENPYGNIKIANNQIKTKSTLINFTDVETLGGCSTSVWMEENYCTQMFLQTLNFSISKVNQNFLYSELTLLELLHNSKKEQSFWYSPERHRSDQHDDASQSCLHHSSPSGPQSSLTHSLPLQTPAQCHPHLVYVLFDVEPADNCACSGTDNKENSGVVKKWDSISIDNLHIEISQFPAFFTQICASQRTQLFQTDN